MPLQDEMGRGSSRARTQRSAAFVIGELVRCSGDEASWEHFRWGGGSCLSFVGRVRMNMEGKVGDDSHWVMPFPPWGILGKNSRVSMYKFRVKKWTWLTLFSLSWALWECLVFPQLFLLSATGVVLAHHCELSRVVTCSPCSSLSASSTLWSSPNTPFKSELRHLYPILVSFSYPQTWLWNMLTCLIMECSLRPCWMLRDVFYMSHILFYSSIFICLCACICTFICMLCVHACLYMCVEVKVQPQYLIHLVF